MKKNIRKTSRFTAVVVGLLAMPSLSAQQVTREQADAVVNEHLQSEGIESNLLYINVNLPKAEGVSITTSNEETFRAKYACWTYYLNESELSQCRYLFVKQDDGNLLEVIASNDAGQSDSTQWKTLDVGIKELQGDEVTKLRVYPNPTTGQLTISLPNPSEGGAYTAESVEIYDVAGRKTSPNPSFGGELAPSLLERAGGEVLLDVSHLPAGMYFLKVNNQVYKFIKK